MKFSYSQEVLSKIWKQRNFAYLMSTGLLISNIILGSMALTRKENWIMIPQFSPGERIPFSSMTLSPSYLEKWGTSLVQDLLTVNPDSVDLKVQRFLALSDVSFGRMEEKLKSQAQKIKREGLSTVFYPKSVGFEDGAVLVIGTFMTYFGTDKAPISSPKTYKLSYARGPHGVLVVTRFKEIKK